MSNATRKVTAKPAAMAVGLPDDLVEACIVHLAPVPVSKVGHVVAALERMLVVRPQVIIVMKGVDQLDLLRERAEDIRAEIAVLEPEMNALQMKAAVINAKYRADKRW